MSHAHYQQKWAECMQDLTEQVQIEYLPVQAAEQGQVFDVGFQHYALLYIKYLQIYTKLEDCYDQMVHPQKRRSIKGILETVIIRILELRRQLVHFNPRPQNHFVALDEVLTDLKLNPTVVNWQVPRYFLDDKDRSDEVEVKLKKLDHWLQTFNISSVPRDLIDAKDPFKVNLTMEQAIRIVQKNERGRIGIQRAIMVSEWRKDAQRKEERQKKALTENKESDDGVEAQVMAATYIASVWKRKVERRTFLAMREQEFQFLGMTPKELEGNTDHVELALEVRDKRKKTQIEADDMYERALMEQLENVKMKQGPDMRLDLLEERRNWILDYRMNYAKFPDDFQDYYKRHDEPEEGAEEETAPPPKGGKDAKKDDKKKDDKKDAKKDPKKKGAKDEPEEEEGQHDAGTSQQVQLFVELIDEYTTKWENRDESKNFEQKHDLELCRSKVYPVVETRLKQVVDEQMTEELANLKLMYYKTKKKDKKKKGGKKGKGKKDKKGKVKKWCAAVGMVANREDCFPDLVEAGVIVKYKQEFLKNIYGEFQYLGALQRVQENYCPPPSTQMIKSLVVEHCLLTLASAAIRQKSPYAARSLLLYGPKGSGKTMLARAIATEVGATFLDLSPDTIAGKYLQAKTGSALLVYKTFLVAQDNSPAIIYMDNVEQIFQAAKKKKGGDGDAPSRIKKDIVAAIRQVKIGKESVEQDRILFIGATSRPYAENVDMKELLGAFDEKVWISFPDYGSRVLLWRKCIEDCGVAVNDAKLNLSNLAHVSEGYSSGSIRQTVERVLTVRRKQQLKSRPLDVNEFLGPLSRTSYQFPEEWKQFRDFDHLATGEKDRLDKVAAETEKLEGGGKDDPKKKK